MGEGTGVKKELQPVGNGMFVFPTQTLALTLISVNDISIHPIVMSFQCLIPFNLQNALAHIRYSVNISSVNK